MGKNGLLALTSAMSIIKLKTNCLKGAKKLTIDCQTQIQDGRRTRAGCSRKLGEWGVTRQEIRKWEAASFVPAYYSIEHRQTYRLNLFIRRDFKQLIALIRYMLHLKNN